MKLDLKAWIDKVLSSIITINNRTKVVEVLNTSYTPTAGWAKRATFTASVTGLYRVRTSWNNSAVQGQAIGASTATSVNATIMMENSTNASIDNVWFLPAGSYSVWVKCASASTSTNGVLVYRVLETT